MALWLSPLRWAAWLVERVAQDSTDEVRLHELKQIVADLRRLAED